MALKQRTQNPPAYVDYRSYKRFLRIEFEHRCAYCEIREPELGGAKSFHIDHYRPKSRFSRLITTYANLFYSCRDCNDYKGEFWPGKWQRALGKLILNPCDHDFAQHYDRSRLNWLGKTRAAKWNIDTLRFNSPLRLGVRQDRENTIRTIELLEKQKALAESTKRKAERLGKSRIVSKCQLTINDLQAQIDTQTRRISGPME